MSDLLEMPLRWGQYIRLEPPITPERVADLYERVVMGLAMSLDRLVAEGYDVDIKSVRTERWNEGENLVAGWTVREWIPE